MPTRLLDWTLNPFVALFFALGTYDLNEGETIEIEISVLKKSELGCRGLYADEQMPAKPNIIGDVEELPLSTIRDLTILEFTDFNPKTVVKDNTVDYYIKLFTEKKYDSEDYYLIFYNDKTHNVREKVQEGLFTVYGNKAFGTMFPEKFISEKLSISLSKEQRDILKERLNDRGISHLELFPNEEIEEMVVSIKKETVQRINCVQGTD